MYNNWVSINKVLSSKPIYSTCISGLSVFNFRALKRSIGVNTIEKSAHDVSFCLINSFDLNSQHY